ncbi:DUF2177 family protein [Mesorhizobium sp. ASY16-5R]|uniref:DUF2177 family protein n=1 Tax=Mesorhizobium sp. ASY16-5R TaxID=3445772 RepID=UPI003FA01A64
MKYAAAYSITLVIFLALDALWLGALARGFYAERMGGLMLDQPRWLIAALFYLLYVVGLVYFAVTTGLAIWDWRIAAFNGGLFGFFCYLTYNATCLAVIRGFDPLLAVVDTGWGTVASAISAGLTVTLLSTFARMS